MQFRRPTCTSVLLACATAIVVFAYRAPVGHANERVIEQASDIQVRDWNSGVTGMMPRYSGEDVTNTYTAVLEVRDRKRPISKTKPKPAAAQHPKAPAPKQATGSRPKGPVPKPNTRPAQKPGAGQCNLHARGAKQPPEFSPACDNSELTLGDVTRTITKVPDQGNSAITYKVHGGWPLPTNPEVVVTAYVKTGPKPDSKFKDEAKWLRKTDQLLAEGPFGGYNFIVFRGVADGRHIVATHFFATHIIPVMKGQEHFAKCEELVKQKLELVVQEVKTYVTKFGILHTDIQPGNILWDEDATKPTLIDWGRAREEKDKHWTPEIEKQVREQAEFSHLHGQEKICGMA